MTSFSDEPIGDLSSKKIIVFGGTGGLGRSLCHELVSHGALATVVGRTFRDSGIANIEFVQCDLSSIKSSVALAESLVEKAKYVDVVLFTTGIIAGRTRVETDEGLERDIAVSFLSRVAIMDVIGPHLHSGSRVFVLAFPGHGQLGKPDDLNSEKGKYMFVDAHMNGAAGSEAMVVEGPSRFPHVHFYGMNPGYVGGTGIGSNVYGSGIFGKALDKIAGLIAVSPETYAHRVAPAMVSDKIGEYNGVHIDRFGKLLAVSEGMTGEYAKLYIDKAGELLGRVVCP